MNRYSNGCDPNKPKVLLQVAISVFLLASLQNIHWAAGQQCDQDATTCLDCLNQNCSWAVGMCLSSCSVIADAACYDATTFPDDSNEETCQIVDNIAADEELCATQDSCTACVETTKASGDETCQWVREYGACGIGGCDMMGICGSTECDDAAGQQQCDQDTAAELTTCLDCLNQNCSWAVGMCLSSCGEIADAACYDTSTFPEDSNEETCQFVDDTAADEELCAAQDSCTACIETVKTSNDETCQWVHEYGGCGIGGCDMNGVCGSTECDAEPQCDQDTAAELTTCLDCLNQNCSWAVGTCLSSCSEIADAACYDMETFPEDSNEETCQFVDDTAADEELCAAQETCTACIETTKTSSNETCQWVHEFGGCGIGGCDMNGFCGSTECDATTLPEPQCDRDTAADLTTCLDCLDQNCGWAVGTCLSSCGEIADAACYDTSTFPEGSNQETCQFVDDTAADEELCAAQDNCAACVATTKTSGNNETCQWVHEYGGCGIGACDMEGICGSTECNVTATNGETPTTVGSSNATTTSGDDSCNSASTCDACLSENCAWAPSIGGDNASATGTCLSSCREIADAACYDEGSFPDKNVTQTCQDATQSQQDAALCVSKSSDCEECIATEKCAWFDDGVAGYCGAPGCDMNGVCGSNNTCPTTTNGTPDADASAGVRIMRTTTTMLLLQMAGLLYVYW